MVGDWTTAGTEAQRWLIPSPAGSPRSPEQLRGTPPDERDRYLQCWLRAVRNGDRSASFPGKKYGADDRQHP
jgi:hypothetical protein